MYTLYVELFPALIYCYQRTAIIIFIDRKIHRRKSCVFGCQSLMFRSAEVWHCIQFHDDMFLVSLLLTLYEYKVHGCVWIGAYSSLLHFPYRVYSFIRLTFSLLLCNTIAYHSIQSVDLMREGVVWAVKCRQRMTHWYADINAEPML